MRILIAGLLGGIVLFIWGFVSHMVLPLGEVGLKTLPFAQQDTVIEAARGAFVQGTGVYIVPGFEDMADYSDKARAKAVGERAASLPYAFVVYQPQGVDVINDMGPNLGIELATNVLAALLAAFVVSHAAARLGRRALLVAAMGLFAWLSISVPYWNWYRFPLDFTLANLAMQVIGWGLAGLAIAGWLGRGERRTF